MEQEMVVRGTVSVAITVADIYSSDVVCIKDGWVYVGFKVPVKGEYYINKDNSHSIKCCADSNYTLPRIIVRREMVEQLVFTATGEHRYAEWGEWFKTKLGDLREWRMPQRTSAPYDIYRLERHMVPRKNV